MRNVTTVRLAATIVAEGAAMAIYLAAVIRLRTTAMDGGVEVGLGGLRDGKIQVIVVVMDTE